MRLSQSFIVLSLIGLNFCSADTSLFFPGFDPQPISVNVLGVDANGDTTYQVLPGEPTGTWVGQDPAFIGTGTLVEGANNAIFNYANADVGLTLIESCTIANDIASCSIDVGTTTFFDEELATPFLVQGGGTAAPFDPSSAVVPAQTTTGMSATPGGSAPVFSPTGTAPAQISPSPSGNSGVRSMPSIPGSVGVLAAAFWVILG